LDSVITQENLGSAFSEPSSSLNSTQLDTILFGDWDQIVEMGRIRFRRNNGGSTNNGRFSVLDEAGNIIISFTQTSGNDIEYNYNLAYQGKFVVYKFENLGGMGSQMIDFSGPRTRVFSKAVQRSVSSQSSSQISSVSNKNWQKTSTDTTFIVPSDISALKVLVSGVSGGKGGTGSYDYGGSNSVYPGGDGGGALKAELLLLNVKASDTISINRSVAGANSTQHVTGINCGTGCPVVFQASSGATGESTKLYLNGEVLVTVTGGIGGTGAYKTAGMGLGSPGDSGAPGTFSGVPNVVLLNTEDIGSNVQSALQIFY